MSLLSYNTDIDHCKLLTEGENDHTVTIGNILEQSACGTLKNPPNSPSIPGNYSNNAVAW